MFLQTQKFFTSAFLHRCCTFLFAVCQHDGSSCSYTQLVPDIGTFSFAVDHTMYLYLDGVLRHTMTAGYNRAESAPVAACVIAVHLINDGGSSGFLASATNGLRTDTTWKCSSAEETGWKLCNFDDSHWSNAVSREENTGSTWWYRSEISDHAHWIWDSTELLNAFCRKQLC